MLAMVVMGAPSLWLWPRLRNVPPRAWVSLGIIGVADAFNTGLYFAALNRGPVAVAVLTHYMAPILVALLATRLFDEPLSRRVLVSLPVVFIGVALLLGPATGEGVATTAMLGGASAIFYAAQVLGCKEAAKTFSALAIVALHTPIAVALLAVAYGAEAIPPLSVDTLKPLAGALLCGLLATTLFNAGLPRVRAQVAGVLTYLEPVVAAGVGALFFSEALPWVSWFGFAAVLGAGAWVAVERFAKPPA